MRPAIKVMDDGVNAVIVIEGLAKNKETLKRFYESAGKIMDAIMVGTIDVDPPKGDKEGFDTSNVKLSGETFEGKTPAEVLNENKDKGYYILSTHLREPIPDIEKVAINQELLKYVRNRFDSIKDGNAFADKLSEKQCETFLTLFDYAATQSLRRDIAEQAGYESYEDIIEYAETSFKRLAISMIINHYKK